MGLLLREWEGKGGEKRECEGKRGRGEGKEGKETRGEGFSLNSPRPLPPSPI